MSTGSGGTGSGGTGPAGSTDEEFREFMRGRWPAMVRLAYGLTGDLGHAEDVAQAAFARAYASWGRVTQAGDPDAYLRRIVVNENRRRFRRRRVTEELFGTLPDPGVADSAAGSDQRAALLAALARLGPRQRAVIVLRFWMDLSEAETAHVMGCTVGTVKSQASRALATLRADGTVRSLGFTDLRRAGDSGADDFADADIIEGGLR
ncbi:MAG TPA: SigE family RNA polymerase sigma factor [Trebonia sp.]